MKNHRRNERLRKKNSTSLKISMFIEPKVYITVKGMRWWNTDSNASRKWQKRYRGASIWYVTRKGCSEKLVCTGRYTTSEKQ